MPVKLRLQRQGRKKIPYYLIVAASSRTARGGQYIERIGMYNPLTNPATVEIDNTLALKWLNKGAQPTETVKAILSYKGVLYKKHLLRGVNLGVVKAEEVESKFEQWLNEHNTLLAAKKEKIHKTRKERLQAKMTEESKKREEKERQKEQRKAEALAAAQAAETAQAEAQQPEASNDATAAGDATAEPKAE